MKRLLAFLFLLIAAASVVAQNYVYPSEMAPRWGFIRKAPCGSGAGDNCGSNPPTWHLTPDQCGIMISTGAARNADGSIPTKSGIRHTLPTVAEFAAANMNAAGAAGSSGVLNREGQCTFTFVMGAPGPQNYLRIGIDGVAGSDKVTPFAQGAVDMFYGDLVFPYLTPGTIQLTWNGNSWLVTAGTPALAERLQMGQLNAHGQGRLSKVTADPSWWTATTRVGTLAYCPTHGQGYIGASNGGFQLSLLYGCIYRENQLVAAADWLVLRNVASANITAIAAGAAYLAGSAPNGIAYNAGNYAVVKFASLPGGYTTGTPLELHNLRTNNGTRLEGKWIGKVLTAGVDPGCAGGEICVELHQEIEEANGNEAAIGIGPPSSFVAGDALTLAPVNGANYTTLTTENIAVARRTNPSTFHERGGSTTHNTIVGIGVRDVTNGYADLVTKRGVASLFNPVEKKCLTQYTVDRTTASLTFAEPNTEIRCTFAYINGVSKFATDAGDTGRRVRYAINASVSNNTNGAGCAVAVAFNGGAAEAEIASFTNPAGTNGHRYNLSLTGSKEGLVDGSNFITLVAKAITAGTCTINAADSSLVTYIWQ